MNNTKRKAADLSFALFFTSLLTFLAGLGWTGGVKQLAESEGSLPVARQWTSSAQVAYWIAGTLLILSMVAHLVGWRLSAQERTRQEKIHRQRFAIWRSQLIQEFDLVA